jgi:hypothetical protein
MMVYLDFTFVNNQTFGLNKCKQIMESKNLMEINNPLEYELQNSPRFLEWLECKVLDATSNLMHGFRYFIHQRTRQIRLWRLWKCGIKWHGGQNLT